ncbi:MAG: shikimate dehydrogenase [Rhodospirillales bacterium]|nr:shikimate dehydrogenase [Rhodospirillales bacterium]
MSARGTRQSPSGANDPDLPGAISGGAKLVGVIGWPVAHSLSPRLHGYWLRHHKIDGAYVPLAVRPEDFASVLKTLPRMGFAGVNVTLPHKESALAAVDTVDATAREIGAVNMIVATAEGRLDGRNTDAFGFIENLKHGAPEWEASVGPAVVLGAGGAARAVCRALADAGVPEIRIANRTIARARGIAEAVGANTVPWDERSAALDGAALLVNATNLGMEGKPSLELDLTSLPAGAVVNDIVYNPIETGMLKAAAARGNVVVDGLGMLLHQARPGFAAWFGTDPAVTEGLRAYVLRGLAGRG